MTDTGTVADWPAATVCVTADGVQETAGDAAAREMTRGSAGRRQPHRVPRPRRGVLRNSRVRFNNEVMIFGTQHYPVSALVEHGPLSVVRGLKGSNVLFVRRRP